MMTQLRRVIRHRLCTKWETWPKCDRKDAKKLALSFITEIPEYIWPLYFATFGPTPKMKDVPWVITTEHKKLFRQLDQRRRNGNLEIEGLFQVPKKKSKLFREDPPKYFHNWVGWFKRRREEHTQRMESSPTHWMFPLRRFKEEILRRDDVGFYLDMYGSKS